MFRVALFLLFFTWFNLIEPHGDYLTLIRTIDSFRINGLNFFYYRINYPAVRDFQFLIMSKLLSFIRTKLWLDFTASLMLSGLASVMGRSYGKMSSVLLVTAFFWPPLYVDLWRQFTAISTFLLFRKYVPFFIHIITAVYLWISTLPNSIRLGVILTIVYFSLNYSSTNQENIGLAQTLVLNGILPFVALVVRRELRYIFLFPILFFHLGETWLAERFFITAICFLPFSVSNRFKPFIVTFGIVTLLVRLI